LSSIRSEREPVQAGIAAGAYASSRASRPGAAPPEIVTTITLKPGVKITIEYPHHE
jgi:hypothetical protein